MDVRGSIHQLLHQESSLPVSICTSNVRSSHGKLKAARPSLPSIPPWATNCAPEIDVLAAAPTANSAFHSNSSNGSRTDIPSSEKERTLQKGWERLNKSYFTTMKRLPCRTDLHQQCNMSARELGNQEQDLESDNQSTEFEPTASLHNISTTLTGNKWKSRALLDPFAKQKRIQESRKKLNEVAHDNLESSLEINNNNQSSQLIKNTAVSDIKFVGKAIASPRLLSGPTFSGCQPVPPPVTVNSRHSPLSMLTHSLSTTSTVSCPPADDADLVTTPSPVVRSPWPIVPSNQHHTDPTTTNTTKTKLKGTAEALAEIKRKREERRAAQAMQKQKQDQEQREFSNDLGYKFRRLIQSYRKNLPIHDVKIKNVSCGSIAPQLSSKLSVFVRKRPLSSSEKKSKSYEVVTCLPDQTVVLHEPKYKVDGSEMLENWSFQFDECFDTYHDNTYVYEHSVGPLIPYLIVNRSDSRLLPNIQQCPPTATVFAYGQTGSGKTYTMQALYRQASKELLDKLEMENLNNSRVNSYVKVSFYEIYMNYVTDLLKGRKKLKMLEDGDGQVQLLGLSEHKISTADDLLSLVHCGEEARVTTANAVHDDSSRSHAILRITVYSTTHDEDEPHFRAQLLMVDLAGSERASDTQTDSHSTRREGAAINISLLALKECIRALHRNAGHVPFRQSKLTQLLRDSFLSECSKTVMIAALSPASCGSTVNNTLNTLRYADRLKEIGSGGPGISK